MLLISFVVVMLISSLFQKSVAQPIIELAATARRVSRDKDYAVRARKITQKDELAVLVGSFNDMLREIEKRDSDGNGIGLATVRRIIQRQGSKIWAEGDVEKGASFYFTLGRNNPAN